MRDGTMSSNPQKQVSLQRPAFAVAAGESRTGQLLNVVGDQISIKISSRDSNGAFTVFEDCTPPMAGPPLHLHYEQDEWWHILKGQYLFVVDGKDILAGPGDTVFAPRGRQHTFQNIGATPARALITAVPGGLDIFFEELSAAVPPGREPTGVVVSAIFKKHGLELLGPPLGVRKAA